MNNVKQKKDENIKMIKHFIKDLSFENPQNINLNNSTNNNKNILDVNMNVVYTPFKNNFFSLVLKYNFNCFSKEKKFQLFILELDYFGFFKMSKNNDYNQKSLTEHGLKLLFPYAKQIIEDITKKGGSIPILLNDIDFNKLVRD